MLRALSDVMASAREIYGGVLLAAFATFFHRACRALTLPEFYVAEVEIVLQRFCYVSLFRGFVCLLSTGFAFRERG